MHRQVIKTHTKGEVWGIRASLVLFSPIVYCGIAGMLEGFIEAGWLPKFLSLASLWRLVSFQ